MKAIDKLIELRKEDPSIVAIAKDRDGNIFYSCLPIQVNEYFEYDAFSSSFYKIINEDILFPINSDLVTYKDLENYEVKMMSISVQDYERLVHAEKTLENIKKFLS